MPNVGGYIVPEIENHRVRPEVFNILVLDSNIGQVSVVASYIEVFHNYLDTLGLTRNRIRLYVVVSEITRTHTALEVMNASLKFCIVDVNSKDAILGLATQLDIDVILDEKMRFAKSEVFKHNNSVAIVHHYNPNFNDLLNAVCTGWGVAWNFRDPIWRASWLSKYLERDSLAKKAFNFMDSSRKQNYTDEQRNFIRNLSNKITHVSHSKQMLESTCILLRYAKRHNLKKEDLLFELTHHLNNYYMFISSSLDVLARLINDVYRLGFSSYRAYSLDNKEFLSKLEEKRKGLVGIIRLEKYLDWMDWMRQRRNLFAHQSHLYLTPLIQQKQVPLTDAELDALVDAKFDWSLFTDMDVQTLANMKEVTRFHINLEENYETIAEEMMEIHKRDRKTGDIKPVIFFPLKAIEQDRQQFDEIMNRLLDNLIGARAVK